MSEKLYTSEGLNWDLLSKQYNARLDEEEARGLNPIERRSERELEAFRAERIRESNARSYERRRAKLLAQREREGRPAPKARKPDWDVDRAVKLYEEGKTLKDIAKTLGKDVSTVRLNLIKRGVHQIGKRVGGTQGNLHDSAPVIKMYEEGASFAKIGKELGMSPSTARKYVLEAGKLMSRRERAAAQKS